MMGTEVLQETAKKLQTSIVEFSPETLASIDKYRQEFEGAFEVYFPTKESLYEYFHKPEFVEQELGVVLSPVLSSHFSDASVAMMSTIAERGINPKAAILHMIQGFAATFVLGYRAAQAAQREGK